MWYLAYNVGLLLAFPVIVLILLGKKRCRQGFFQRLGLSVPSHLKAPRRRDGQAPSIIWIHAVSLGEVVAVAPLVRALHQRYPHDHLVVSTVTETGREAVERHLADVAQHCYAPLDFPWAVARYVRHLAPRAFLFVETELWPNLLRTLWRRGVPVVMVNGRLSSDSYRRYRLIRPFMRELLETVSVSLMQSHRDAERILALGARKSRVQITGNLKFDQPSSDKAGGAIDLPQAALGLLDGDELLVAGSTHPGEEEQLLAAYERLHQEFPSLVLLLAPRHTERAAKVEALARGRGLTVHRRSALTVASPASDEASKRGRVIVLDTRGELAQVYRYAVLTFVGGTLVPIGGHNLLEPAQWGKPVFFGPYTDHCADIAQLLIEAGGGLQVRDQDELAARMAEVLRDRGRREQMGQQAKSVVLRNRGALDRHLASLVHLLDCPMPPRPAALDPEGHVPSFLLCALAWGYGMAVRVRLALYRRGWLTSRRLPCRVVSVGNLTVGGAGKTPVVIALVEQLLAQGLRVGVLSRGYRRHSRAAALLVSDGQRIMAGPDEAGDEPYLIACRCPRAVVAVGTDRYRLGCWVLEHYPIDCFVLDDGFQHLAVQRDVDLLLVDVSDPAGLQALVPAGRLREPLSGAARATALLLTRADLGNWRDITETVEQATGRAWQPIVGRFCAEALVHVATAELAPVSGLATRPVVAASGIAHPGSFRVLLEQLGCVIHDEVLFADHHAYRRQDLDALRERMRESGAEMIVTTEKDAVKLATWVKPTDPIWAVRLRLDILHGQAEWERLVQGNEGMTTRSLMRGVGHG
jgi:3-deoxy-D-manno-octulosonic-acid transferase